MTDENGTTIVNGEAALRLAEETNARLIKEQAENNRLALQVAQLTADLSDTRRDKAEADGLLSEQINVACEYSRKADALREALTAARGEAEALRVELHDAQAEAAKLRTQLSGLELPG